MYLKKEIREAEFREWLSQKLDEHIIGTLECIDPLAMKYSLIERFKRMFDISLKEEDIVVIFDKLENPKRNCLSVHVEFEGQHYESIIRNMDYWRGELE